MEKPFTYRDNLLYAEEVPLDDIAREAGTPCFRLLIEMRF
jgi:hypothetical protein